MRQHHSELSASTVITQQHSDRDHSELSASNAARWWECPASIKMSRGKPDKSSRAANEGTAAHQVAEDCLVNFKSTYDWIGESITVEDDIFVVDEAFAEYIQVYVNKCEEYFSKEWEHWVERKFDLESLRPSSTMWGTSDFVAYNSDTRTLVVIDLKFGFKPVYIENNKQLRFYALGAWLSLPSNYIIEHIEMVIVQPRAFHGAKIKSETISAVDLMDWSIELLGRAEKTKEDNLLPVAGEWCHFCPCRGECPAQAKKALSLACDEFDFLLDSENDTIPPITPFVVKNLSIAQITAIYESRDLLTDFLKAVEDALRIKIELGESLTHKIVPNQARLKWIAEDEIAAVHVKQKLGLSDDKLWSKKFSSPAQVRKMYEDVLKEKGNKKSEREILSKKMMEDLVESKSSGTIIVPISDPRPALPMRGSEFDAVLD